MASQKIAMGINLRQNKIEGSSAYGKYYPEVDQQKTLSLRGFAQHMTDHGSIYGRAIVEGVLMQITECLPELVAQGVPVQLGSLGTFYPTAEVKKDAAVPNIAAMDGLNPNDVVKAIHPIPARFDQARQPLWPCLQGSLHAGVPQHHRDSEGRYQRQGEERNHPEAHRHCCGRVEGAERRLFDRLRDRERNGS